MAGDRTIYDCVIVGGGFTGLSAALTLLDAGKTVRRDRARSHAGPDLPAALTSAVTSWRSSTTTGSPATRTSTTSASRIGRRDQIVTRQTRTGMYYSGNFFRLSTPMDLLRFTAIPLLDRIRTGLATLARAPREGTGRSLKTSAPRTGCSSISVKTALQGRLGAAPDREVRRRR
jgi:glycine/D-amino acid oxidase-like deaminating enzyme